MAEKVAIVGSRRGADLARVDGFVRALHDAQPDTVLVSGGADGVDKAAESLWLELGGEVWSYRVRGLNPETFAIEKWELGCAEPRVFQLVNEPTWATREAALFYRNSLIAEVADRVVAFYRRLKSSGTACTLDFAHAYGRPSYVYEAGVA